MVCDARVANLSSGVNFENSVKSSLNHMSVEDAAHEYNESDDGPDGLDFGIDPVQISKRIRNEFKNA